MNNTVIKYDELDDLYDGVAAFTRHGLTMKVSIENKTIILTGGFY